MSDGRESLFRTVLGSFFRGLFWIVGLGIGLIIVLEMIKGASNASEGSLTQTNSITVLPNAQGERKELGSTGPVVLQLNIHGVIGLDGLTSSKIRRLLTESREGLLKDNRVKALLLSIRSPGGTTVDSEGIHHAIVEYKKRYGVPVVAYVDGLAASGGFAIAVAADQIVSSDSSLIGSVGTITPPFFNLSDAMGKVGVGSLTLFAGKDKDAMNPFRPWKPDESNSIQDIVNFYYASFVDLVTRNRPKLSRQKLIDDYGARVFPAKEALEFGYIDAVGFGPTEALNLLLTQAKLENEDYRVVELGTGHWLSSLFDVKSPLFTGKVQHQLLLSQDCPPELMGQFLYLYRCQAAH